MYNCIFSLIHYDYSTSLSSSELCTATYTRKISIAIRMMETKFWHLCSFTFLTFFFLLCLYTVDQVQNVSLFFLCSCFMCFSTLCAKKLPGKLIFSNSGHIFRCLNKLVTKFLAVISKGKRRAEEGTAKQGKAKRQNVAE